MKKTEVVYMGRVVSNNKLVYRYCYKNNLKSDFLYFKKQLGIYPIGTIIQVTELEEAGTFKNLYVGIGKVKDEEIIHKWQIEDALNNVQIESQKHWKKLKQNNRYNDIVLALKTIKKSLSPQQRALFDIKLISDINKG